VLSSSQKPPRGDFTNTPSHHPTGHLPTPTLTILLNPPCRPPPPPLTLCLPAATSPPLPSPPTSAAPRRPWPSLEWPVPSAAAPHARRGSPPWLRSLPHPSVRHGPLWIWRVAAYLPWLLVGEHVLKSLMLCLLLLRPQRLPAGRGPRLLLGHRFLLLLIC